MSFPETVPCGLRANRPYEATADSRQAAPARHSGGVLRTATCGVFGNGGVPGLSTFSVDVQIGSLPKKRANYGGQSTMPNPLKYSRLPPPFAVSFRHLVSPYCGPRIEHL